MGGFSFSLNLSAPLQEAKLRNAAKNKIASIRRLNRLTAKSLKREIYSDFKAVEIAISEFKLQIEKIMQEYDQSAFVSNITHAGDVKLQYPICNTQHANVVYVNIELEHTPNLKTVIDNIKRKFHNNNHVLRGLLQTFDGKPPLSIEAFRQSVEPAIYSTTA